MSSRPAGFAAKRLERIARVLWIILAFNLLVAGAKIYYGQITGALAISADGLHSLVDATANVVGLVAVVLGRRPPDADHPYGHRKYETIAAMIVAGLLFLGSWEIGSAALERLRDPRVPVVGRDGYMVLGLTLLINLIVVAVERREGRRLGSELLLADAEHTLSDVWATLLALGSLVLSGAGVAWADLAAAAIIVALILRAGVEILRGTLSTLADERRIPPEEIEQVAQSDPQVLEVHNVRSRGPLDDIHLDLHVLVHPALPIAEAHAIGHRVERTLRERWPGLSDVVVHVEPALDHLRAQQRTGGGLVAED